MDLVVADSGGTVLHVTDDFSMDMEFGVGTDNSFELSGLGFAVDAGSVVYVPGTEWGGVVDEDSPTHSATGDSITYSGRTWHGVLEHNVICPDEGESHLVLSGDCNEVIATLLDRAGLGSAFSVGADCGVEVSGHRFDRYVDLYEGIVDMLSDVGMRLQVVGGQGGVTLSAVAAVDWGDELMPGEVAFSATRHARNVNHLVVLGKGELTEREVVHLYADEDGNVSTTQSLFGLDHVAQVYELSSEEGDDLVSKGTSKLRALQESDEVTTSLDEVTGLSVGDSVTVTAPVFGVRISVTITGLVIKVSGGVATVEPQTDGELDGTDYE